MDHPIATALRGKYMHLDQRFKVPETHPMVHATVKTATFPRLEIFNQATDIDFDGAQNMIW